MNNEQQILELAKSVRSARKKHGVESPQAINKTAELVRAVMPRPVTLEFQYCIARDSYGFPCVGIRCVGCPDDEQIVLEANVKYKNQELAEQAGWTFGPWHSRTVTH